MKLITYRIPTGTQAGRVEGEEVVSLPFGDIGALLASGEHWMDAAAGDGDRSPLAGLVLAPTIVNPPKIICIGLNYRDHVEEMVGRDLPEFPTLFAKYSESLCGPNDKIMIPTASTKVDWEVELVVVIGKSVRNASDEQAVNAIAGYAVGNDVSMRDWQYRTSQFLQGKIWESSTPLGAMVTKDEIGADGRPDLAITTEIDGVVMQDSRTKYLMFDCIKAVTYISTAITLHPGDVIYTGTASGVGAGRKPPVFLQPGQVVTTRIEGIGECINEFYAE